MENMICELCGDTLEIGSWPFCHGPGSHILAQPMIASDDIPGGLEIRHALLGPDGAPRKFYSKSEIRKAAFEAGLTMGYETPRPNARLQDQEAARAERGEKPSGIPGLRSR